MLDLNAVWGFEFVAFSLDCWQEAYLWLIWSVLWFCGATNLLWGCYLDFKGTEANVQSRYGREGGYACAANGGAGEPITTKNLLEGSVVRIDVVGCSVFQHISYLGDKSKCWSSCRLSDGHRAFFFAIGPFTHSNQALPSKFCQACIYVWT